MFPYVTAFPLFPLSTVQLALMYLRFPISIGADHDINQHWLLDFLCLLKGKCQRCVEFFWCFCKVTFSSKCLNDSLIMSIWFQGSGWGPTEYKGKKTFEVLRSSVARYLII